MTKRKPPKLKKIKGNSPRPKVRRTWTINPTEQVVENEREGRPNKRQLSEDALEEYNEGMNDD